MRARGQLIAAIVAILFMGAASHAWAEKGSYEVRFGVLYSTPTGDYTEEGQTTEMDSAFGFQASFEFGLTDLIGVEPGIAFLEHDVNVKEAGESDLKLGDMSLIPLTVNVNFHVLRGETVDLYVGPTVGYAFWGSLESELFQQDFPANDEFLYGANVGIDIPFGEGKWGFNAALSYLVLDAELDGGPTMGVDPLQIKAGVLYKF